MSNYGTEDESQTRGEGILPQRAATHSSADLQEDGPPVAVFGNQLRRVIAQEVGREQTLRKTNLRSIVQRITSFVQNRQEIVLQRARELCQQRHVVTFLGKEELQLGKRPSLLTASDRVGSLSLVEVGKFSVNRLDEALLSEFKDEIEDRVSRRLEAEVTLELLQETGRHPETNEVLCFYQAFVAV